MVKMKSRSLSCSSTPSRDWEDSEDLNHDGGLVDADVNQHVGEGDHDDDGKHDHDESHDQPSGTLSHPLHHLLGCFHFRCNS